MTSDSKEPKPAKRLLDLAPKDKQRRVRQALLRVSFGVLVLALIYCFAPLDSEADLHPIVVLMAMLMVFVVLTFFSVRRIMNDDYPQLRAAQVAVLTVTFYLFGFAALYLSMSTLNPTYFTEPLTHVGAFYFTVTVASTVGFGDITPNDDLARIIVTAQMMVNIALIGVGVRAILALGRMRASTAKKDHTDPTESDPSA
ncbi:MAG: potassium channel family protein [Candidatus Nanopelagicales bacterium]